MKAPPPPPAGSPFLSPALNDPAFRAWVRRRLLSWFAKHARALPWRLTRDPYPIWVSEVMLQQTQVATVIPYFQRFLERFPDLQALAIANEHDVLRPWAGLGYYRRARDLHRAARLIVSEHGGQLPREPGTLRRLPGFGRYTVAAVLSQAFDQRLPIVETNSRRVLSRLLGVQPDASEEALWAGAESLLPRHQVGHFNQSLMELGALVCSPFAPACDRCPLHAHCYARRHNLQETIPAATRRPRSVAVAEVAVVVRQAHQVLLVRRPEEGRWGNMWEFPHDVLGFLETTAAAATRLLGELGLRGVVRGELGTISHTVTHHRITMTCVDTAWRAGAFCPGRYVEGRWLENAELDDYALSTPQRRLAKLLHRAKQPS